MAIGAVYLWLTTGLAFCGATEFCASAGRHVWQLVAFLFFIMLFLVSAVVSISIQIRSAGSLPDVTNGVITFGVMAFGIGSYLVELAALLANEHARKARLC